MPTICHHLLHCHSNHGWHCHGKQEWHHRDTPLLKLPRSLWLTLPQSPCWTLPWSPWSTLPWWPRPRWQDGQDDEDPACLPSHVWSADRAFATSFLSCSQNSHWEKVINILASVTTGGFSFCSIFPSMTFLTRAIVLTLKCQSTKRPTTQFLEWSYPAQIVQCTM